MKRTVSITDLPSLERALSTVQFPCSIEISYTIRKSKQYALREDLPEHFGFREMEGQWGFIRGTNFFEEMNVGDIAKMALTLHADVKLIIDEYTEDEYVNMVRKRHGLISSENGWVLASDLQIRQKYHYIRSKNMSKVGI